VHRYAVGGSLDSLFHYIAEEEAAIRTNPACGRPPR
jgi:hypothetical protein